mgnify:CR=1 FL=1
MNQAGGDRRDHQKWIKSTIEDFYRAYYTGDRLKLYSFFDTDFQRKVPLNIFLYHPNYNNIELGVLIEITEIQVVKVENKGEAAIKTQRKGEILSTKLNLKMEFGKWKVIADNFF